MSTLDRAFIKAYAKDPGLPATPLAGTRPARRLRRPASAASSRSAASAVLDDPYVSGVWYRIDEPDSTLEESSADSPDSDAAQEARRRRNARRPHVRFREEPALPTSRVGQVSLRAPAHQSIE